MSIDAVYVLGDGSPWGNNELRYSLRSLEEYVTDLGRVWLVGRRPNFVQNICFIPSEDPFPHNRDANIFHKTKLACEHAGVSKRFLFINDDHFLLEPFAASGLEPYSKGPIANDTRIHKSNAGSYPRRLKRTMKELESRGHTAYHYDIHCPMLFEKKQWLDVMSQYEWDSPYGGFVMKSLYGNTLNLGYYHMSDMKFGRPKTEDEIWSGLQGRWVFSINDNAINDSLKTVLKALYPTPSIYEKRKTAPPKIRK